MCKTKSLIWALVVILLLVSCPSGEDSDLGGDRDIAEVPTDAPNAADPTATTTLQPAATTALAATDTAAPTVAPTSVSASKLEPADKSAPITIYCGSGHRSTMAMTILCKIRSESPDNKNQKPGKTAQASLIFKGSTETD